MTRVTRIDAVPAKQKNLQVAAYCRVSTLMEDQQSSIASQREHFTSVITNHPGWDLAGIYLEEGVSGTKKEIRPELNRMLADCRDHKIDLILTKSISRFARNTTDCLEMVRTLTGMGIRIIFEKENVDTTRMGTEFLLTVMSSVAEAESHSISGNAKWAVEKRFQAGTFRCSGGVYGYRVKKGAFTPDLVDAAVVRWIFDQILSGVGMPTIAAQLNQAGLPSPDGGAWTHKTVGNIVKNPEVVGDLMMKKTYTDDHFRSRRNFGEKPMYYFEDHHEGIIDREKFDLAQAVVKQRLKESGNETACKRRHLHPETMRYAFTGKIVCGQCGSPLQRDKRKYVCGERIYWHCNHKSGFYCNLPPVMDADIKNAFETMIFKLRYAPFILDEFIVDIRKEETEKNREKLTDIQEKLKKNTDERNRLTSLFRSGSIEPVFYWQKMTGLQGEANALKTARYQMGDGRKDEASDASQFRDFVRTFQVQEGNQEQEGKAAAWEKSRAGEAFQRYVEKVTVRSRTCFTFRFSFGLQLTEETDTEAAWTTAEEPLLTGHDPAESKETMKRKEQT